MWLTYILAQGPYFIMIQLKTTQNHHHKTGTSLYITLWIAFFCKPKQDRIKWKKLNHILECVDKVSKAKYFQIKFIK